LLQTAESERIFAMPHKNDGKTHDPAARLGPEIDAIREWKQPLNRADTIGLFGVLMGTLFVLIVPTVWYKVPAFLLLCFGSAYLIWASSLTCGLKSFWRKIIIAVVLVGLNVGVVPQFVAEWRTEHMHSELTFDASAPGLAYPDGDHYGIKWHKEFAEVRLTVTSKAQFPIQNVNLSIWTVDKTDTLAGMAQSESEPQGCVVRRPRGPSLPPLVLRGNDGSNADITPSISDMVNANWPLRDHYDLLCQRVLAGESITLVIAALMQKQNGGISLPPLFVHVKGNYETAATEGSKRVEVDEVLPVSRP